jgi:hypothetical protein
LFAIVAHADDVPRFPIDSVVIEGARYTSPRILIAESKIEEGRAYTEPELRNAVARVQRLPFVRHTDFRLEKGSQRGRYVLVIAIEETKLLFISYRSLQETIDTQRLVSTPHLDPNTGQITPTFEKVLLRHNEDFTTVGVRSFLGAKGVAHASVDFRGADRFNLGYTQYDVLGTRASIALLVQYRDYSFDFPEVFDAVGRRDTSFTDHVAWQITGAIPLFGNNAIRATWYRQRDPYTYRATDPRTLEGRIKIIRLVFDHPEVSWLYDSTNDPLFPTSGTYIKAGVDSRRGIRFVPGPTGLTYDIEYDWNHELAGRIARYWELTPVHSISVSGDILTDNDREFQTYQLRAGYSANLWGRERTIRYGDLRFEAEAERNLQHFSEASSNGTARAGLAFRNSWGVVRLDFRYVGWRQNP